MRLFSNVPDTPEQPSPTNLPRVQSPLSSLVASAKRLTAQDMRRGRKGTVTSQGWQDDAWEMYDLVGEQRFLSSTLANRLSQARLYVGKVGESSLDRPEQVNDEALAEVLESVGGNTAGLSQLIRRIGLNLFIPGECWVAGVPTEMMPGGHYEETENQSGHSGPDLADLEWRVLSVSEVNSTAVGTVRLQFGPDELVEADPEDIYLIRVWNPHPRKHWEADSPVRSNLPVLRELVGLTMHISAQVDSRLAGAGVFVVPESAKRAVKAKMGSDEEDDDPFTDALIEAMVTPISDRSSASAVVPLVVTAPDDVADKFHYITFSSGLDGEARELRDEAIRRLALGQDAPPELLLGTDSMNHWGAWLVREDVVNTHIEPHLALICDALTTQYLWPVMRAMGYEEEEVREHVIWYDVDHMIMRPNRTSDAFKLHGEQVISDEALRHAAGFGEEDAPVVEQDLDPAVTMALDIVARAPSLARDPGLGVLVEQIRSLLAGETPPSMNAPASAPEPPAEPGGPPQTDEDDAPQIAGDPEPDLAALLGRVR